MAIPLDAREILSHLNQLGYRNITPEQLKEFQKDLRKLIKFDTRTLDTLVHPEALKQATQHMNTFQRLHTLTTISYNAKINRKSAGGSSKGQTVPPAETISRGETPLPDAVDHHQPQARVQEKENLPAAAGVKTKKKHPKEKDSDPACKMWIRPRSTSAMGFRKNDPVSLYHAYQKEWTKFKNQLPGENSHSDLRWQVRTKLLAEK
uniref:Centriolar and ciliogenesis-associated protein HYLS1 C-terminal domain-containing protein n=1 Tax=Culex tarsalis TaxID=7177 RepID=A0A1Q3EWJ0_CULTA